MPSSNPQPVQQTSTQKSEPWGAQQPYLTKGFAEAERIYNDPSNPSYFPGQTYANPDAATTSALSSIESRAMAGSPLMNQGSTELGKTLSGQYLNPNTNPGFQSVLDTTKANTLPGIDSRFMGAGRSGSGLHGRAVGEGLGSAIGNLTYGNYNDERNRMSSALGMAPQYAQADYTDAAMLGQVGAAREAQAQQGINEAMQRHDFNANLPQSKLANYMQMIQGNYGGSNTSTGTQYMPGTNPWMQALGLGLQGASAAGMIFSDERLKEDIKPVGETFDGLPIYTYKYKGGGTPMMGVMAQDVEKVKPEAVAIHPSGFRMVDYLQVS